MRTSKKLTLIPVVMCFAAILLPTSALATTTVKNCPSEPAQNVPISSGVTYSGAECVLSTTGDVDSFVFSANAGDTWNMDTSMVPGPDSNICLTLYPPGSTTALFSGCSDIEFGVLDVYTTLKLPTTGTYTIVVTESDDATVDYGLSLERLSPAPADAVALTLAKNVSASVVAPSAVEAYTFYGTTTSSTFQITASIPSNSTENLCFNVYEPNGTSALSAGAPCTDIEFGTLSISAQVTPPVVGTYVVLLWVDGDDGTVSYDLEASCLLGTCTQPPPKCSLADALSYSSGTLTMNFTIGTPSAVTWNAWLVSGSTTQLLFSTSQPVTEPPVKVTQTAALSPSEIVGVLSTLNGSTGISCSSWNTINTK